MGAGIVQMVRMSKDRSVMRLHRQTIARTTSCSATGGASIAIGDATDDRTAVMERTSTTVHRRDAKSTNARMDPASWVRSVATVDATAPTDTTSKDALADRTSSPAAMAVASRGRSCATDVRTATMGQTSETVLVPEVNSAAEPASVSRTRAAAISASTVPTDRTSRSADHVVAARVSGSAEVATASGSSSVAIADTIVRKVTTRRAASLHLQATSRD